MHAASLLCERHAHGYAMQPMPSPYQGTLHSTGLTCTGTLPDSALGAQSHAHTATQAMLRLLLSLLDAQLTHSTSTAALLDGTQAGQQQAEGQSSKTHSLHAGHAHLYTHMHTVHACWWQSKLQQLDSLALLLPNGPQHHQAPATSGACCSPANSNWAACWDVMHGTNACCCCHND